MVGSCIWMPRCLEGPWPQVRHPTVVSCQGDGAGYGEFLHAAPGWRAGFDVPRPCSRPRGSLSAGSRRWPTSALPVSSKITTSWWSSAQSPPTKITCHPSLFDECCGEPEKDTACDLMDQFSRATSSHQWSGPPHNRRGHGLTPGLGGPGCRSGHPSAARHPA